MKLNLTATDPSQERIKAYLEQNASEALAQKINEGTPSEKDGKPLTNRKTLDGFMRYATEEARKTVAKGATSACIDDATVFGWAIHYFEEESIIGTLYNQDGTPYKTAPKKPEAKATAKPTKTHQKPPQKPITEAPKQTTAPTPKAPQKQTEAPKNIPIGQMSIFDLF